MIALFEKELKEKINKELGFVSAKLSFLKFSTAISGRGFGNKVLFFVFKENDNVPKIVVKSVRSDRDAFAIRQGYHNLKLLNNLTNNSSFPSIFPEALFLHDVGDQIFSVETICSGRKASISKDLENILEQYTSFSKFMSKQSPHEIKINFEYGKKIINELSGSKNTLDGLLKYLNELWNNQVVLLPSVHQHGDLTIDNVLIDGDKIKLIDCDTFGNINIPGFDIYHLTTKSRIVDWKRELENYFKYMGISYVLDKKLLFIYFLHELYIKRDYILKDKDSRAVIMEFETMV